MSATTLSPLPETRPAPRTGRYRIQNVIKAEIAKVLTVPSTTIMFVVTVVGALFVTALVTHAAANRPPGAYQGFDPTQEALTGLIIAALTGGVFGAMLITSEYSSGNIRTTLSATPRRAMLVAAKIGVTALATTVFLEVLSFAAFLLGQAILSGTSAPHATLGSSKVLGAVVLTGLFIALLALMSFGFGLICRSTAGAIACFVGVVFVLPIITQAISPHYIEYMPSVMLIDSIMATVPQGQQALGPGTSFVLMIVYVAIVVSAGAVLFVKRDA